MTKETDHARKTLAELESKLAETHERLSETEKLIEGISFDAHTGVEAAATKLGELYAASSRDADEAKSLKSAIATARDNLAAAESAAAAEKHKKNAGEALALLEDFEKRGAALDAATRALLEEYDRMRIDLRKLEALGFGATTPALVSSNMRTALLTALMASDLKIEHIPPGSRRDFATVVRNWAETVRGRASAVAKPKSNKAAKAA